MQLKIRIHKRNKKEWVFVLLFIILLFQIALQYSGIPIISTMFNYIDEMISCFFAIYIILKVSNGYKFVPIDKKIIIVSSLFLLSGFVGSILHPMQPIGVVFADFLTCSKFVLGYLGVKVMCGKGLDNSFIKRNFEFISKVISVIFFILALHDEFMTPFFKLGDQRYFGNSIQLFYPHASFLAAACGILLLILAVSSENRRNNNYIYMIMLSVVIILTFRSKAIAFIAVFWGIYILGVVFKVKSKFAYAAAAVPIALYLGYDQIMTYFLTSNWSARAVMFKDAFLLAKKAFPFGMGYASFGSNMSVQSYSPLYNQLGYNSIYGMSKDYSAYLNDGFWQTVIGQFGIVGLILFITLIVLFFKMSFTLKSSKVGFFTYDAVISLNIYMLISSVAEPAYFAPFALLYFILLAYIVCQNRSLIGDGEE